MNPFDSENDTPHTVGKVGDWGGDPSMPEMLGNPDDKPANSATSAFHLAIDHICEATKKLLAATATVVPCLTADHAVSIAKEIWEATRGDSISFMAGMLKSEPMQLKRERRRWRTSHNLQNANELSGMLGVRHPECDIDGLKLEAEQLGNVSSKPTDLFEGKGRYDKAPAESHSKAEFADTLTIRQVREALLDGNFPSGVLQGTAHDMRLREELRAAKNLGDIFGHDGYGPDAVVNGDEVPALLSAGWKYDDGALGSRGFAIPGHGWQFHMTREVHRLVHPDRPDYKYELGPWWLHVHFDGMNVAGCCIGNTRTCQRIGVENYQQAVFLGLKAFARDAAFFAMSPHNGSTMRMSCKEAEYELAQLIVEARIDGAAEGEDVNFPPALYDALSADPFGYKILRAFQGPMSAA